MPIFKLLSKFAKMRKFKAQVAYLSGLNILFTPISLFVCLMFHFFLLLFLLPFVVNKDVQLL